jgi:hypothetical protein
MLASLQTSDIAAHLIACPDDEIHHRDLQRGVSQ